MLFGKVKMLRFIIICSLIFNCVNAKVVTEKYSVIDEQKFPNIFKSNTQFKFKEIIISFLNNKNLSYLVFDLVLERETTSPSELQEEDLPLVTDTILSDLFPSINLFTSNENNTLQQSLQQRIDRVLKAKFKWITGVKVLNMRIQGYGND